MKTQTQRTDLMDQGGGEEGGGEMTGEGAWKHIHYHTENRRQWEFSV